MPSVPPETITPPRPEAETPLVEVDTTDASGPLLASGPRTEPLPAELGSRAPGVDFAPVEEVIAAVIRNFCDSKRIVLPATEEIVQQMIDEGIFQTFLAAGAAVSTPTCGPCLGGHMGCMCEGERCVSTTNRNFVGRMGHVTSEVILASPTVAAASAVAGCVADPAKL